MTQTVFITGTSTGIGAATVRHFAARGWQVAATLRNPADARFADLPNVRVYALDVTDAAAVPRVVAQAQQDFGRLDVVINNAGYGLLGPFESATPEQIQQLFATNVFGAMAVIRAALPIMRAQQAGTIINITSVGGRTVLPMNSLYHATKFSLDGFSEALWYELGPLGIQVKIVAPGFVATDFTTRSLHLTLDPADENSAYARQFNVMFNVFRNPVSEAAQPEQTAEVIYEAATDGKSQLYYVAGADAEGLLAAKAQMSEAEFAQMIQQLFAG